MIITGVMGGAPMIVGDGVVGGQARTIEQPARGVVAIDRAQAATSLVEVPVDRMLGKTQLPGDFLGAHMAIDESEAFALTLGEAV